MGDWSSAQSGSKRSAAKDAEAADIEAEVVLGMRQMLQDGISKDKIAKRKRAEEDSSAAEHKERQSNRTYLECLDNSLRHGTGRCRIGCQS